MLETGLRDKRSGERERERNKQTGKGRESKKESIQRQRNKVRGRGKDGEHLVPVTSPFGPLMWRVTASLTEE